jgi:hypothetical protein
MFRLASARTFCRAPFWGLAAACCSLLAHPAFADPEGPIVLPETFNRVACYQMVQQEGRMIAWARWEQGYSQDKMQSAPFAPETPTWMVKMVQRWISDAYNWEVTDEQVYQWAAELGNTDDLPTASRLSPHQTIAIWMRRIAKQCGTGEPT